MAMVFWPLCQRMRKLMKSRIPNGTCVFCERTDEPLRLILLLDSRAKWAIPVLSAYVMPPLLLSVTRIACWSSLDMKACSNPLLLTFPLPIGLPITLLLPSMTVEMHTLSLLRPLFLSWEPL